MRKIVKRSLQIMSLALLLFLILTVLIPFLLFSFAGKDISRVEASSITVIAHRGASGHAPENTLASFSRALEIGADIVELDVHLSADDSVIVMHDRTVDRTTNGKGAILSMSFEQIRQLDAGSWFDERFAGEKVPTLSEVLQLVNGRAKVLIELKWPGSGIYPRLVEKVMQAVKEQDAQSWVILQSFETRYLEEAAEKFPGVEQQQLIFGRSTLLPFYYDRGPRTGNFQPLPDASSVNIFYLYLTKGWVKKMHASGKKVYVFTPNSEAQLRKSLQLGADGVITNFPDKALSILKRK